MAFCTSCGMVMHDEDAFSHVCNQADLPVKGKPIPKGKTKAEVI